MMPSSGWKLVALVAVYLFCALAAPSSRVEAFTFIAELPTQPCANVFRQLEGSNLLVNLNGSRTAFNAPNYPGGPYDMASTLFFQWSDIREVGRNGIRCSNTKDQNIFVQSLYLCECSMSSISQLENGVNTTGWNMTISKCPAPQESLLATAQVTVTNVTTYREYTSTMTGSTADAFNYTSAAGAIKFGFAVQGWTWNTTANQDYLNNTYLGVGLQFGFSTPKNLTITQSRTPLDYFITAYFDKVELQVDMELGYLLNGIPTVTIVDQTETPLFLKDGTSLFAIETPFPFCQPTTTTSDVLTKWDNIYYDPSIVSLFGDITPPSLLSPKERSSKRAVEIAVPIVVILFAIIVVTIVLLVLFVPSVRNALMPFNDKKVREARGDHSDIGTSDSWKHSTRPTV